MTYDDAGAGGAAVTGEVGLSALFECRSLAVIGASDRKGSAGWRLMSYLDRFGYDGEVVPVNPNQEEIGGLRAYPTVGAYGHQVDQAVLVVPPPATFEAVRDCGQSGVRVVSVFASGYAETGSDGRRRQDELVRLVRGYDMRMLGPNCLGVINSRNGLVAAASSAFESVPLLPGNVSIVTQSGALGVYLVALLSHRNTGIRYYVSTGNEADIATGEVLSYVVDDPETHAVVAYAEGLRDAPEFVEALRRARDNGTLVVTLKAGSTEAGAEAVRSHTAALAGDSDVFDAVCERYGAFRARSLDEAVEVTSMGAGRRGDIRNISKVGVLTVSGGLGALAAEAFVAAGFEMPNLPLQTQASMRELVPYCSPMNPVDITGHVTSQPELFAEFLDLIERCGATDAIVVALAYVGLVPRLMDLLEPALIELAGRNTQLIAALGAFPPDVTARLEQARIVVSTDAVSVARQFALTMKPNRPAEICQPKDDLYELPEPPTHTMSEPDAMRLLDTVGIRVAQWTVVSDTDSPEPPFDLPAVAKLLRPGVIHKTEEGFVLTGLHDLAQIRTAVRKLTKVPEPGDQVILQAAVPPPFTEFVVAARRDEVFGPVVIAGLGGTLTEVIRDRVVLVPPLDTERILRELSRLRGWQLLEGFRGAPSGDVEALVAVVVRLERLLHDNPAIQEVEINPLLVRPAGLGATAVDAVVRISASEVD